MTGLAERERGRSFDRPEQRCVRRRYAEDLAVFPAELGNRAEVGVAGEGGTGGCRRRDGFPGGQVDADSFERTAARVGSGGDQNLAAVDGEGRVDVRAAEGD